MAGRFASLNELIDIGVNLTGSAFKDDVDDVIQRARQVGVIHIVVTGTSERESEASVVLAERHPSILSATAGVHPHHASEWTAQTANKIGELAAHEKVVAVGECGLDFNRNYSPREDQERAFAAQLELAQSLQKPAFLHERDSSEIFLKILKRYRHKLNRAVLHCFTGDDKALAGALDLDLHIGITGWICDERRGLHLRELVGKIPSDRLMLETDAPYLLPRDLKPKPKSRRNEPANLPHILQTVAKCLGEDAGKVAQRTSRTAKAFFGLTMGSL